MERIKLTKEEKQVFLHVAEYEDKQPKCISPATFHYCLATLQEKGLVVFVSNYDKIIKAHLTIKGEAYREQNPLLKNPIDWKSIIILIATIITSIATTLALFVACNVA